MLVRLIDTYGNPCYIDHEKIAAISYNEDSCSSNIRLDIYHDKGEDCLVSVQHTPDEVYNQIREAFGKLFSK